MLTLKLFKNLYAGVIAMEVEFSSCFFNPFENAFVVNSIGQSHDPFAIIMYIYTCGIYISIYIYNLYYIKRC